MTKVFVGSLPPGVQDDVLWAEFGKYGQVTEVYVQPNCEPGRQWAKVTFAAYDQAAAAKVACDRILTFPGADRPCDVTIAKNQGAGAGPDPGFGQGLDAMALAQGGVPPRGPTMAQCAPCKIFVGSLPDGVNEMLIREHFAQFGDISDVYVKQGCEAGRQWAFVTFGSHEQAAAAIQITNGVLVVPGSMRPCEVMLARNQGMFGQDALVSGPRGPEQVSVEDVGPKKIFVGSLPDGIQEMTLRGEFGKYGNITDVFIKTGVEPGRQWAFITFSASDAAATAKSCCDRVLTFPGSVQACEVTLARNQGMFGQNNIAGKPANPDPVRLFNGGAAGWADPFAQQAFGQAPLAVEGPKKIFVGSLPDHINDQVLRAEFGRFGQIVDVFLKQGCESGRQWAFVTFATSDQAQYAKESADRVLVIPGADKACEVMLAKNQGKNGEAPLHGGGGGGFGVGGGGGFGDGGLGGFGAVQQSAWGATLAAVASPLAAMQPPPPAMPPPPESTPWREYKTASGLPYYHNHATGVTQWEPPAELLAPQATALGSLGQVPVQYQDPIQAAYGAIASASLGQAHYNPY